MSAQVGVLHPTHLSQLLPDVTDAEDVINFSPSLPSTFGFHPSELSKVNLPELCPTCVPAPRD